MQHELKCWPMSFERIVGCIRMARFAELMHADLVMAVMLMETQLVTCIQDAMRWVVTPGNRPFLRSPEYVACSSCEQRARLIDQIHRHLALIEAERTGGPKVDTLREIARATGRLIVNQYAGLDPVLHQLVERVADQIVALGHGH